MPLICWLTILQGMLGAYLLFRLVNKRKKYCFKHRVVLFVFASIASATVTSSLFSSTSHYLPTILLCVGNAGLILLLMRHRWDIANLCNPSKPQ